MTLLTVLDRYVLIELPQLEQGSCTICFLQGQGGQSTVTEVAWCTGGLAGAGPVDSEDEGDIVIVADHPAPPSSAQTVQTAQTATQQHAAVATDTTAQPSSNAQAAGHVPGASQAADSDEDADTWQFMALPAAKAQQQTHPSAAETARHPKPGTLQQSSVDDRAPGLHIPAPSARQDAKPAAPLPDSSVAAPPRPKPAAAEWDAELEPQEPLSGGRTAAAAIAAAAAAAAGMADLCLVCTVHRKQLPVN